MKLTIVTEDNDVDNLLDVIDKVSKMIGEGYIGGYYPNWLLIRNDEQYSIK